MKLYILSDGNVGEETQTSTPATQANAIYVGLEDKDRFSVGSYWSLDDMGTQVFKVAKAAERMTDARQTIFKVELEPTIAQATEVTVASYDSTDGTITLSGTPDLTSITTLLSGYDAEGKWISSILVVEANTITIASGLASIEASQNLLLVNPSEHVFGAGAEVPSEDGATKALYPISATGIPNVMRLSDAAMTTVTYEPLRKFVALGSSAVRLLLVNWEGQTHLSDSDMLGGVHSSSHYNGVWEVKWYGNRVFYRRPSDWGGRQTLSMKWVAWPYEITDGNGELVRAT